LRLSTEQTTSGPSVQGFVQFFVVVQIIQDTILVPTPMGKVTGLNPAMMILSMSIWGKAARPFGDDHRFAGDLFAAGVLLAIDRLCPTSGFGRRI